jgi:2,4-dienoyl-CoA reductase-like NADH-dependent reductase (Old Yellow Enzyme family)/thioredoxin reductase
MDGFEILRQPIAVGNLVLKHRMTMAPMDALRAERGYITQGLIDYYSARAKGGAALIMVQIATVDGRHLEGAEPRIYDDCYIPGLQRLSEAIHSDGVPVIVQLHHAGPISINPISPSGTPCLTHGGRIIKPASMSLEQIEETRELYIEAAVRAGKAGFDGVEVHGATGYLLQNFISPRLNKRTDRYGGSPENRMRLQLEIVRGIREKCGPEFVVGYGLVADDLLPDGTTLEDSVPFAVALEKEGADFVDIRAGTHETLTMAERATAHSKLQSRAGLWEYSEAFKKVLKIPVFCAASGCYDPVLWKEALEKGRADVVQLAKSLICDPDLPKKVLEGRIEDIRTCLICGYCLECRLRGQDVSCAINLEVGKEGEYAIKRVPDPKKVLVAGGGPGGLEAGRVAALRGHKVTVMEKAAELGGNLRILSLCLGNDLYMNYRDWLVRQCTRAGVKFELGREVTPQVVKKDKPDVVIVATGAPVPVIPPIPGIDKPHVVTPEDVLTGKASVGKNVVVIGGGLIGVDTAYTIAAKGWAESVNIIEPLRVPVLGYDIDLFNRTYLMMAVLPKYKVNGFTGMRIEEITDREVAVVDREGKRQKIKADTVVVALGYSPNMGLYEALRGESLELYAIGDCEKARYVAEAVHEGSLVARQI